MPRQFEVFSLLAGSDTLEVLFDVLSLHKDKVQSFLLNSSCKNSSPIYLIYVT